MGKSRLSKIKWLTQGMMVTEFKVCLYNSQLLYCFMVVNDREEQFYHSLAM